jgi:hypothetical protein
VLSDGPFETALSEPALHAKRIENECTQAKLLSESAGKKVLQRTRWAERTAKAARIKPNKNGGLPLNGQTTAWSISS